MAWQNCNNRFAKDEIMDFIQNGINLLLRSGRPFLILAVQGVSPMVFQIDGGDIWIAFLAETGSI